MGEPEGRTGPSQDPEGSALPEGAHVVEGSAASAAPRVGVPPLHGRSQSAPNLDLLLDEPLLLVTALRKLAAGRTDQEWTAIYMAMCDLEGRLERLQEPASPNPR